MGGQALGGGIGFHAFTSFWSGGVKRGLALAGRIGALSVIGAKIFALESLRLSLGLLFTGARP